MTTSSEAVAAEVPLNDRPHVLYRMFDATDVLLYVGITADIPNRLAGHRREKVWWREIAAIRLEHLADRTAALDAERDAIETEHPKYNIRHAPGPLLIAQVQSPELEAALQALRDIAAMREKLAEEEAEAIEEGLRAGLRQSEVARLAERSREHIRRIAKQRGVPSRYPPRTPPGIDAEPPETDDA